MRQREPRKGVEHLRLLLRAFARPNSGPVPRHSGAYRDAEESTGAACASAPQFHVFDARCIEHDVAARREQRSDVNSKAFNASLLDVDKTSGVPATPLVFTNCCHLAPPETQ